MSDHNYDPEIYTLSDENGVEHTFELLDTLEDGGNLYYAMVPVYDRPEDSITGDAELVVLKSEYTDGEEMLVTVDDEDEYDRIGNIFLERLEDYYDPDEDEDENEPDDGYEDEEDYS